MTPPEKGVFLDTLRKDCWIQETSRGNLVESRKQSQVVNSDDHLMTSARETNILKINDLAKPFVEGGKMSFTFSREFLQLLRERARFICDWVVWNFKNNIWRLLWTDDVICEDVKRVVSNRSATYFFCGSYSKCFFLVFWKYKYIWMLL